MRVLGPFQVLKAALRAHECATHVDIRDQVVALDGRLKDSRDADYACVVNQNIYATKFSAPFGDSFGNLLLLPNVDDQWQCLTARSKYFFCCSVDGSRTTRIRFAGSGSDNYVRTIACGSKCFS